MIHKGGDILDGTPRAMPKKHTVAIYRELTTWKAGILSAGLIVVLALVVYGHLWRSGYTPYSKHSDLVTFHLPMKWAAYQSVSAGQGLPFWKSDQFAGSPAMTNPQSLYTNPFHLLSVLMDPAAAAGPTLWIHFLVMGLGMYVWGWSMGLGSSGRLFMAVAGLLNFKLIIAAYAGWMAAIPAVTMSPWLLAALTYCVRRPGITATATLGGRGALFLVAGHPQFLYYTVLLGGSYVLMHAVAEGRRRAVADGGAPNAVSAPGTALAVGIAAPLLISLVTDRGLITRSSADYAFFLGRAPTSTPAPLDVPVSGMAGHAGQRQLSGGRTVGGRGIFRPDPAGPGFVGVVIGWSRRPTRWLAAAAAICLLLAADTPIGRSFFDWLPFYALFLPPNRFLFFVSFLGIALAGIGVDELLLRWRVSRPPEMVGRRRLCRRHVGNDRRRRVLCPALRDHATAK